MALPTPDQVHAGAVAGAGRRGHGIAPGVAQIGAQVRIQDALQGAAPAAIDRIAKNLAKGVELGKVTTADRDAALARITAAESVEAACKGVDCVIEAVPEHLELKRELFAVIDRAAPAHALLATNTSSLPVGDIATVVRDATRLVGMHFFNPVHVMKL